MPLFQEITPSEHQHIAIWSISETAEELEQMCTAKGIGLEQTPQSRHQVRVNQWMATRLLLHQILGKVDLTYDEYGKPILAHGPHLSISHAKQFVVIHMDHKKENGVDIEEISEKVERIQHKFLVESEIQKYRSLEDLTLCWSAKEALYKTYGKKRVDFKAHLHVLKMDKALQRISGHIDLPNFNEKIELSWKKIDNFVMVYTV